MAGFWIDAIIAIMGTWIYFIHFKNFRLYLYSTSWKIYSLYINIERDTLGLFWANAWRAVAFLFVAAYPIKDCK
jgi:hypothetical protein